MERRIFALTQLVDNLNFIVFRGTALFRWHYDKACSACRNGLYRITIWTFLEYGRRLSGMRKSLFRLTMIFKRMRCGVFFISKETSV